MLAKLFKQLNFSPKTCRVYTRLLETGPSSARQLSENLNIPRPSVYDSLKILIQNGLVAEQTVENKKIFQVDDIKNLPRLLDEKISALGRQKTKLEELLPSLSKKAQSIEPKIRFYSGVKGVKQVLKDMLWYQNTETYTMWPISEMVEILGKEYLAELNRKRIQRNISIKGIWPREKGVNFKEHPYLGVGKRHLRELRFAPHEMVWNMSYWIYADKAAFISSQKEMFGFVITSAEFVELMEAQFKIIWKMSTPIKAQPRHTDSFLKTV
jgi:sugar-specific transcriptional regulator TrmB